jgi:hypothetical protein
LDFIQEYFVDNLQECIFYQIYGPANDQIEVHFDKKKHKQVQAIEKVIIPTLSQFMTDTARNVCFVNILKVGVTPQSISMNWKSIRNPSTTKNAVAPSVNAYNGKRKIPGYFPNISCFIIVRYTKS